MMDQKLKSGKLDQNSQVMLERSRQCFGLPVYRIGSDGSDNGKGSRGVCAHCFGQTHWYCLGCKRWMCNTPSEKAATRDEWRAVVALNLNTEKPVHFLNCCMHETHGEARKHQHIERDTALRLSM